LGKSSTVAVSGSDRGKPQSASISVDAGFAHKTLNRSGGRLDNDRFGVQGDIGFSDRLTQRGENSDGDLGFGADAGADYSPGGPLAR